MKKFIKNIKSDRITFSGFILSLLLIVLSAVFIAYFYGKLPPFVPIFNQLPWGNDRLTETIGIFLPVVLLFAIFIFNLIFTSSVYDKNPLIGRFVAATTFLISVMNFIYIVKTILIII